MNLTIWTFLRGNLHLRATSYSDEVLSRVTHHPRVRTESLGFIGACINYEPTEL